MGKKGLNLQWAAAAHKNTNHDHVHVVVLGTDKNGRQVRIGKDDHDHLRQHSDRYLERDRDRSYDRELDRESKELARNDPRIWEVETRKLDSILGKGQIFNLTDDRDQDTSGRAKEQAAPTWSKKSAVEKLPEREKIQRLDQLFSKYDKTEDLKRLSDHVRNNYPDRLDKQQYAQLKRWIETKERDGEDCFERWDKEKERQTEQPKEAHGKERKQKRDEQEHQKENQKDKEKTKSDKGHEAHRQWQEFDRNTHRAYEDCSGVIYRRMPRKQRIFEERGRNLEHHAVYMNTMAMHKLREARERTEDPKVLRYIERELEELKKYGQELAKELPTVNLDKLYGKEGGPKREWSGREPDGKMDLDKIKFPDHVNEGENKVENKNKSNSEGKEVKGAANNLGNSGSAETDSTKTAAADLGSGNGAVTEAGRGEETNVDTKVNSREKIEPGERSSNKAPGQLTEKEKAEEEKRKEEEEKERERLEKLLADIEKGIDRLEKNMKEINRLKQRNERINREAVESERKEREKPDRSNPDKTDRPDRPDRPDHSDRSDR